MTGVTVGLPGRHSGAATVTVTAGSRVGAARRVGLEVVATFEMAALYTSNRLR